MVVALVTPRSSTETASVARRTQVEATRNAKDGLTLLDSFTVGLANQAYVLNVASKHIHLDVNLYFAAARSTFDAARHDGTARYGHWQVVIDINLDLGIGLH